MIDCETVLLVAVRDVVRTAMGLNSNQCDIELDDEVPAISGDRHVTVTGLGIQKGPRHNQSGGTIDLLVDCRVTVFHRTSDVPQDRRREVFLNRARGMNKDLTTIMAAVDFKYGVLTSANTSLGAVLDGTEGFIEPLKFSSIDAKPTPVSHDPYNAASKTMRGSDPTLALKRGMNFVSARFLKVRT